jgi:hypothetical protein
MEIIFEKKDYEHFDPEDFVPDQFDPFELYKKFDSHFERFKIQLAISNFVKTKFIPNPGMYADDKLFEYYEQKIKYGNTDFLHFEFIILYDTLSKLHAEDCVRNILSCFDHTNSKIFLLSVIANVIKNETVSIDKSHPLIRYFSHLFEVINLNKFLIICAFFDNDDSRRIIGVIHDNFNYDVNNYFYQKLVSS